jgi:hypothetical protein
MTSSAMRTIIDLPEVDRVALDAQCRQRGLSRAEGIRQALRLWLQQQRPSSASVFGLWGDRDQDAVALQQALRDEWAGR